MLTVKDFQKIIEEYYSTPALGSEKMTKILTDVSNDLEKAAKKGEVLCKLHFVSRGTADIVADQLRTAGYKTSIRDYDLDGLPGCIIKVDASNPL